jgi:hypothetical protein
MHFAAVSTFKLGDEREHDTAKRRKQMQATAPALGPTFILHKGERKTHTDYCLNVFRLLRKIEFVTSHKGVFHGRVKFS